MAQLSHIFLILLVSSAKFGTCSQNKIHPNGAMVYPQTDLLVPLTRHSQEQTIIYISPSYIIQINEKHIYIYIYEVQYECTMLLLLFIPLLKRLCTYQDVVANILLFGLNLQFEIGLVSPI